MKRDNRNRKPGSSRRKKPSKLMIALYCAAVALLVLIIAMMLMIVNRMNEEPKQTTAVTTAAVQETTAVPTTEETTEATTAPVETEPPVMLDFMAELYEKNPDTVGYIRIGDTKLDYPVMYTPDDEEKYLRTNFDGGFDIAGVPFIDTDCSLDPESDNLIIYGHNMANGTAFRTLMSFEQKSFWEKNPNIYFSTLYEERNYEIVAAFYDRVYYKTEDCFKFYQFIDAENEADFNEAIAYYKEHALYDTGITPEYGDKLITLVTCAYHVENGRFVVIGRLADEAEK